MVSPRPASTQSFEPHNKPPSPEWRPSPRPPTPGEPAAAAPSRPLAAHRPPGALCSPLKAPPYDEQPSCPLLVHMWQKLVVKTDRTAFPAGEAGPVGTAERPPHQGQGHVGCTAFPGPALARTLHGSFSYYDPLGSRNEKGMGRGVAGEGDSHGRPGPNTAV